MYQIVGQANQPYFTYEMVYDPATGGMRYIQVQHDNWVNQWDYLLTTTSEFPATEMFQTVNHMGQPQSVYRFHLANAMLPGGANIYYSISWVVKDPVTGEYNPW